MVVALFNSRCVSIEEMCVSFQYDKHAIPLIAATFYKSYGLPEIHTRRTLFSLTIIDTSGIKLLFLSFNDIADTLIG